MGRGERHVFKKSPLSDNTDNRDKMKPNKSTNECRTQPDEVWQKNLNKNELEMLEIPKNQIPPKTHGVKRGWEKEIKT